MWAADFEWYALQFFQNETAEFVKFQNWKAPSNLVIDSQYANPLYAKMNLQNLVDFSIQEQTRRQVVSIVASVLDLRIPFPGSNQKLGS